MCKKECKYWTNNDHCSQLDWAQLSWAELWVEWVKLVDPMREFLLDFDEISEKGRNIYEWNEINPILLDIDLLRTCRNESGKRTFWRFGISISINIQYWLLLSNVTLRGEYLFLSIFNIDYYFPMSLYEDDRNYPSQNWWNVDWADLDSIIPFHFIITSHR